MGSQNRVYPNVRGLLRRTGQRMAVPLFGIYERGWGIPDPLLPNVAAVRYAYVPHGASTGPILQSRSHRHVEHVLPDREGHRAGHGGRSLSMHGVLQRRHRLGSLLLV